MPEKLMLKVDMERHNKELPGINNDESLSHRKRGGMTTL
jgi:hypothetical protein